MDGEKAGCFCQKRGSVTPATCSAGVFYTYCGAFLQPQEEVYLSINDGRQFEGRG